MQSLRGVGVVLYVAGVLYVCTINAVNARPTQPGITEAPYVTWEMLVGVGVAAYLLVAGVLLLAIAFFTYKTKDKPFYNGEVLSVPGQKTED